MAFRKLDRQRLLELAGIQPVDMGQHKEPTSMSRDSDAGLHGEHPTGGDETTDEHLDKETSVFHKVHDALEELMDFLHSQEGFEEKRGKEDEYSEMEHDAEDLLQTMKKHLAGYGSEEGSEGNDEEHSEDEDLDKPDLMRMVK